MLKEGFEPIPGYRLLNFLGRGQFGEVWRATSPGGTYIALKFLNVRERQGRKEFRAIQKVKGIRYPHLVQTYALWLLDENLQVIDDAAFDSSQSIMVDSMRATMIRQPLEQADSHKPSMLVIATVLCDQNLMERLTECKQKGERGIPPQELLGYIEDAAKAIDFLNTQRHELGEGQVAIHHCDIKPENIMILGDLAVVGDFGVARILGAGGDARATTTMGGSVAYAAPETYDNRTAVTSDQYSLAITYYELRTGKLPFPEESQSQVMKDKLSGHLDLREVLPREAKVLRRALSVDPLKRFPSSRTFVAALQDAVSGKKSEKRTLGIGTILVGASALALIVAFSVKYFGPVALEKKREQEEEQEKERGQEKEKVDGSMLYAEALREFRQSNLSFESISKALEKSVPAIMEGGYLPVGCRAVGRELTPVFQTRADELDENHCLKLIAMSVDKSTLVKAVHHTLHFSSLKSDQSIQIELQDIDVIVQLAWMQDEIVLLDNKNRLLRVNAANGIPQRDGLIASQMAIPCDIPSPKNWLAMSRSADRKKLLLLDGQESSSIGTFKVEPGQFHISIYSEGASVKRSDTPLVMNWQDRSPTIAVDEKGDFFLAGANYDGEIGTLSFFSSMSQPGMDLVDNLAMKELQEFTKVQFVDSSGSFLLAGILRDTEEEYRLVSGLLKDGKIQLTEVRLANEMSIGAFLVESSDSVLVSQSTKLLRCARKGSQGEWETKELFDFEDGLMTDGISPEGATGKINAVCKLNDRWILTGHETGKAMLLGQQSGSPPLGFEICSKLDCAIQDIQVTQDKVVLIGQDGRLLWFDLADILLNAESCRKTGIAPRQTMSKSVGS